MKCKSCKRNIDEDSIFCKWCGTKLIKERDEIAVPKPRKLASGSYSAQIMIDGKRTTITAPSEKEYYVKARAIKTRLIEIKNAPPAELTVGEALDNYIQKNQNVLSPATLRGYKTIRNSRFKNIIDKKPSEIDWQKAVNDELAIVAPKTVVNAYHAITAALRAGKMSVPEINLPTPPKAKRPWLDFEQINAFVRVIYGQPCEVGALLALHSLRRSEIYALTADKIDLKRKLISVHGAVVLNENGERVTKATNKTIQSTRVVPILIPRLEELLKGADGYILRGSLNTLYKQINAACKVANLPLVGVHGLRHSFASLAYHLKWTEQHTCQVGGWKDGKIVHDIYTHLAAQDTNEDVIKMRDFYAVSNL